MEAEGLSSLHNILAVIWFADKVNEEKTPHHGPCFCVCILFDPRIWKNRSGISLAVARPRFFPRNNAYFLYLHRCTSFFVLVKQQGFYQTSRGLPGLPLIRRSKTCLLNMQWLKSYHTALHRIVYFLFSLASVLLLSL